MEGRQQERKGDREERIGDRKTEPESQKESWNTYLEY